MPQGDGICFGCQDNTQALNLHTSEIKAKSINITTPATNQDTNLAKKMIPN
jgi:hypothetical protein